MASNRDRDRDDQLSFLNNPSSSSSPITDSFLSDSHIGSASGSFQNEGFLDNTDAEFGFSRPEFRQNPLAGTVHLYARHVFLCYKNPQVWPPRIEAAEFDRLPRLLSAALLSRKPDMSKETGLTICEGHDGTETSNGDVLIFPDMIRYRRLTHFDVDTFVEEVLVKDGVWLPGTPERLKGTYVFVCSHGSRDRRCGVCGPPLVSRFREEIESSGLQGKVSVSPCSHIGGHKYAGNVIIFGPNINGEVSGHWYGYVSPDDVPILLEQHIGRGEIVDWLWRGQMGLSEEEQKKAQELRLQLNGESAIRKHGGESTPIETQTIETQSGAEAIGCCQENRMSSCCQNTGQDTMGVGETVKKRSVERMSSSKKLISRTNSGKGRRICAMPTWSESWEREDTYAVLAVACAAVSVGVAYICYRRL